MAESVSIEMTVPGEMASFVRPNLLLLGVQKSGTTWLYHQLCANPEVFGSERKELFFLNQSDEKLEEGFSDYLKNFPLTEGARYYMEASANYFWCREKRSILDNPASLGSTNWNVPDSVKTYAAHDAKFIVVFRHPTARAVSAFYHNFARDRINARDSILTAGQNLGILDMGRYGASLSRWLDVFPRDRFHFVKFDDIKRDPEAVMKGVSEFLGIDVEAIAPDSGTRNVGFQLKAYRSYISIDAEVDAKKNLKFFKQKGKATAFPKVYKDELAVLYRWYKPHIKRLETVTGWDLSEWRTRDLSKILEF